MGLALVIIGLLMVVTGARGTYQQFGSLLVGEFSGSNNFAYWLFAIGGVGALGYIPALQTISRYLLALVLLVLFLAHKGFFAQFTNALKSGPQQPSANNTSSGDLSAPVMPQVSNNAPSLLQSFKAGNGGFWDWFTGNPLGTAAGLGGSQ